MYVKIRIERRLEMTDNEKRAHDLAIAICIDVCHIKANTQISSGNPEVSVDYFAEYMNAYEMALESFNERFPDGK